jgi:hypothetical protein
MSFPSALALLVVIHAIDPSATRARETYSILGGVLIIVGLIGVFLKADRRGWEALVPGLCEVTLLRVNGQSRWWLIGLFFPVLFLGACFAFEESRFWIVPFQGLAIDTTDVLVPYHIAVWALLGAGLKDRFLKGLGFFFGIMFLPWLFVPVLGLGRARYRPPGGRGVA